MKETYIKYKIDYEKYIILIKSGNFYVALNKDALVLSNLLKYKIVDVKNFIKVGFPLQTLSKVLKKLDMENINYLILDKEIVSKIKYKNNNYDNYLNEDSYIGTSIRINKIIETLKNNTNNVNIDNILSEIEKVICKINF